MYKFEYTIGCNNCVEKKFLKVGAESLLLNYNVDCRPNYPINDDIKCNANLLSIDKKSLSFNKGEIG